MRFDLKIGVFASAFLHLALAAEPAHFREPGCRGIRQAETRARWVMGTILEIKLFTSPDQASLLAQRVFAMASDLEAVVSTWRDDSELARIHQRAPAPEEVSAELAGVLERALEMRVLTRGHFSPLTGSLVRAFDLHGPGRWPHRMELQRALSASRLTNLRWTFPLRQIELRNGARLDFDGITKGCVLDEAGALLRAAGIREAFLNFGGQILAIGPRPECPPWLVHVASPREGDEDELLLELPVRDLSVSTTSNVQRSRMVDGRRQGHIVNPVTGLLVASSGSVTVAASGAAAADALSTAFFVAGPEALPGCCSQAFERDPNIDVAFVKIQHGTVKVTSTKAFRAVGWSRRMEQKLLDKPNEKRNP